MHYRAQNGVEDTNLQMPALQLVQQGPMKVLSAPWPPSPTPGLPPLKASYTVKLSGKN